MSDCPSDRVHFDLISGHQVPAQSYKVTRDLQPEECVLTCKMESQCETLVIDYHRGLCEYISTPLADTMLKRSAAHNVYQKICLSTDLSAMSCDQRDWSFERVKGKELTGVPHSKVLVKADSLLECQSACVDYNYFICRSAEWHETTRECRLSPYNRFSTSDDQLKLIDNENIEYLENNCFHGKGKKCNCKNINLF